MLPLVDYNGTMSKIINYYGVFSMKKIFLCCLLMTPHITLPFNLQTIRTFIRERLTKKPPLKKAFVGVFEISNNINHQQLQNNLIDASRNRWVEGILLLVDNNGGEVGQYSTLFDLIKKIGQKMPVVALVTGNAFSGGYLISVASHHIFASSSSLVGSIGVIRQVPRYKNAKVFDGNIKAEVDMTYIQHGKFKSSGTPYKDLSEEDRQYLQKITDQLYEQFITAVANQRKLDITQQEIWAEAQVFSSPEALKLGLIDEIGTFFEAEAKIVSMLRERNPRTRYHDEIEQVVYSNEH
jgi:protease IV